MPRVSEIPTEVLHQVLQFCPVSGIVSFLAASRNLKALCDTNRLWEAVFAVHFSRHRFWILVGIILVARSLGQRLCILLALPFIVFR